jgi:hypothetical protein
MPMSSTSNTSGAQTGASWLSRGLVLDAALIALALLFGALSVTYPFGSDQGLYEYVAREWVQRGAIPYRDVFDHKTPGIYIVYAIGVALFGANEWGIRVLDLAGVVATGLVVARLSTPMTRPVRPGLRGLAVLVTSVAYYGFFDYWSSAQSELWYGLLGVASMTAAARGTRGLRAQFVAGLLGGAAMVMKPTSAPFVAIAVALIVLREREDGGRSPKALAIAIARFAAGAAVVPALVLAYFGAHHALGAMYDIVVGANGFYVSHEKGVRSVAEGLFRTYDFYRLESPFTAFMVFGLALVGFLAATQRPFRIPARYVLASSACLAGFAAVAVQQKFYWLHWGSMIAPFALLTTTLLDDLIALGSRTVRESIVVPLVAAAFLFLYASVPFACIPWVENQTRAISYLTGALSREAYTNSFVLADRYFYYGDIVRVSDFIREHSSPDDTICVRGFNPGIYILADRHYAGRFFWSNFLVFPERAYRREAFLAEDANAFSTSKPRFVVTLTLMHDGLDSTEYTLGLGYHVVASFERYQVLERNGA